MSGPRDNRPANWKRTVKMARKLAERLRALGVIVIFPDDFEIPPFRRIAKSSIDK